MLYPRHFGTPPDLPYPDAVDTAYEAKRLKQPKAENTHHHHIEDGLYAFGHRDVTVDCPQCGAYYDQHNHESEQRHDLPPLLGHSLVLYLDL
jgi:hypothetical protein